MNRVNLLILLDLKQFLPFDLKHFLYVSVFASNTDKKRAELRLLKHRKEIMNK